MIGGFSYLDVALLAILVLSGIVAMYRGLTREVLSILSWVAAAGACVFFVLKYKEEARGIADQFHAPVLVAQVAIGGIIFLIVLIIVHLITARISDTVLDSRVGAIDRILGLLFGLARGFVLVVIPFMFYEFVRGQAGAAIPLGSRCHVASLDQVDGRFAENHAAADGAALADGAARATAGLHSSRS